MMKRLILRAIQLYQAISLHISATALGGVAVAGCRSWPTCSEYAYGAVQRDGVLKGGARALLRIVRCNPFWPAWQRNT